MKDVILEVRDLKKTIHDQAILKGIAFNLRKSTSLCMLGHSGCGKSVLLKCICGLMMPDKGTSIIFNKEEIAFKPLLKRKLFSQNFGLLFQGNALFDSMVVWRNIGFSMLETKSEDEIISIVKEKLAIVGLDEDVAYKMPDSLSGGMQKRVALARALIGNPKILFLDEPTSGLDPITAKNIAKLIKNLQYDLNMTIFSITHDPYYCSIVADYVSFLDNGHIAWYGKKEELQDVESEFLIGFSV